MEIEEKEIVTNQDWDSLLHMVLVTSSFIDLQERLGLISFVAFEVL